MRNSAISADLAVTFARAYRQLAETRERITGIDRELLDVSLEFQQHGVTPERTARASSLVAELNSLRSLESQLEWAAEVAEKVRLEENPEIDFPVRG